MKLPIRAIAARATAVTLLAAGAAVAFTPSAGAAEERPIDSVANVVAQLIYPDPEGMEGGWKAEERIDGWLGYNSFPGGPLGHWGPGPEAVGYYGMVGAVIGGPPLPGNPNPVGGQTSPVADALTAVDDSVFGPSEDYTGGEEPVNFPGSDSTQPPGPDDAKAPAVSAGTAR